LRTASKDCRMLSLFEIAHSLVRLNHVAGFNGKRETRVM
jgi:hypothetical protein